MLPHSGKVSEYTNPSSSCCCLPLMAGDTFWSTPSAMLDTSEAVLALNTSPHLPLSTSTSSCLCRGPSSLAAVEFKLSVSRLGRLDCYLKSGQFRHTFLTPPTAGGRSRLRRLPDKPSDDVLLPVHLLHSLQHRNPNQVNENAACDLGQSWTKPYVFLSLSASCSSQ
jgi:hypothetical protein